MTDIAVKMLAGVFLVILPASNVAAQAHAGASSSVESGEAGARAGTNLYNSRNPTTPLPNSSGNVATDTVKNMGTGQSAKKAWTNAAQSNADTPKPKPKK